ncbi:MAG: hypothetical protein B7C54_01330 [Acidimicrobiales bacterium mtb01]|nr:hypothetical protein [Actinomycetota bacterium]TEX48398.1 MAG: hypothetical protein B7C54_01330 [Acidimicrobiales bacterium mtb01]
MNALLSIGWEPELRGLLTVIIGVVALCGSVYMLLATNMGIRLGFLVAFAGLFGWMASMGAIWWAYGIGLTGRMPTWEPAQPFTIVREGPRLLDAEALDAPVVVDAGASFIDVANQTRDALVASGWTKLPEDDRGRGQAIAAADEIIQVEAELYAAGEYEATAVYLRGGDRWPKITDEIDFTAFFHHPKYAIVEIAPVIPQRVEPGRAPSRSVVDETQPHQYVVMIRDLGSKRQPAAFITIGSTIIFLLCCWMLHRRDKILAVHTGAVVPAKA